jgi:hypothetical protein
MMLGALTGYGHAAEPVLYHSMGGVGAQWPCGCLACGSRFEQLDFIYCRQHYGASVPATRNRRSNVDRRAANRNFIQG